MMTPSPNTMKLWNNPCFTFLNWDSRFDLQSGFHVLEQEIREQTWKKSNKFHGVAKEILLFKPGFPLGFPDKFLPGKVRRRNGPNTEP